MALVVGTSRHQNILVDRTQVDRRVLGVLRLHEQGYGTRAIAKRMNIPRQQIQDWVQAAKR